MPRIEKRLLAWGGVPGGTVLQVAVDVGNALVDLFADCLHEPRNGDVRKFRLTAAQIVDRPFRIPVVPGSFFRMYLEITYLGPEEERIVVAARVVDGDGDLVDDPRTGRPLTFKCEYRGRFGGDAGQDHLTVIVAGAE